MKQKKVYTKMSCICCQESIDRRKRGHVEIVRRNQLAEIQCPRICLHYNCWLEMAGDEYQIK